MPTQLAPAVLAVCHLQPVGSVTDTEAVPPAAGKAMVAVPTVFVQVAGGAAPVDALNAATVAFLLVSARAFFSFDVPVGSPLYVTVGLDRNGIRVELPYAINVRKRPDGLWYPYAYVYEGVPLALAES